MDSGSKFLLGLLALLGVGLGAAGLYYGYRTKQETDELREEVSLVRDLMGKIQEVEEVSSGISEGAARVKREVDALREGTQNAFNQVSAELTRVRNDLNESLSFARTLQERLTGLQRGGGVASAPAQHEGAEVVDADEAEAVAQSQSPASSRASENAASAEMEVYVIRSGDTLSAVASRYQIPLGRLLEANADVDPRRLQVGQEIRVPRP